MKKEGVILLVFVLVISAGLVIAQTVSEGLSKDEENYVKDFVNKSGINDNEITNIDKIDQNQLPDDVDIKRIDENKVGIFQVNFTKDNVNKNVFVITYASNEFKKVQSSKNIQTLYFGYSGISSESSYLESSGGVKLNENIGYVMMRAGSITGISSSLEIPEGEGEVYIRVYKNGKDTGFGNLISSSDSKKVDLDSQSEEVLNYLPGDIISVYVERSGNIKWGNTVTSVELTS